MRGLIERMEDVHIRALSESDFSTDIRARFKSGWEDLAQGFLLAVGSILNSKLNENGYSAHGSKVRGGSMWINFSGDGSQPYAGGTFVIGLNKNNTLTAGLDVKANRGGKKGGALKAASGLNGMDVFIRSPLGIANEILFMGSNSWGDALGIFD